VENRVTHLRAKMDAADRAKQFMPFDALKGFREALAAKERELEQAEESGGSAGETSVLPKGGD